MKKTSGPESLRKLIKEANVIISEDGTMNTEKKEKLTSLLEVVDFLMHNHDKYYEPFDEVFTAMVNMNFSKRLKTSQQDDSFVNYIAYAINTLNEEYQDKIMSKNLMLTILKNLSLKNTMFFVTDNTKRIVEWYPGDTVLPSVPVQQLIGQPIECLFSDYEEVKTRIGQDGHVQEMEVDIIWLGDIYKASLNMSFVPDKGNKKQGAVFVFNV